MEQARSLGEIDDQAEDGQSFDEIFHTLWLRKRLLFIITGIVYLICFLVILQLTPKFTAKTQLLIGINSAKVVDIEEVISSGLGNDTAIIGEMEVIKSRGLAQNLIKKLALDRLSEFNPTLKPQGFLSQFHPKNWIPEDWKLLLGVSNESIVTEEEKQQNLNTVITDIVLSKLNVSQVKRSQVVNISYESEDPKLAAQISNELADLYIIGQLQAKFDATQKATSWLNSKLTELKDKVSDSEQAVATFRKEHNLLDVGKDRGFSQQQLSEVNSQLIIARASRAEAEAKYRQVASILKHGDNIDSVSEVLNSPLIQGLRQQEAEIQRTFSEMTVEYGKKHPKMIQMAAKLEDIRAKITSEIKKIAAGLRNDLDVARSRENSIADSLNQIKSNTNVNKQDEVQLRALEREAAANKALFETFLSRFKETSSTQGIEQADARVISFAEPPLAASFPKKKLLLSVSFAGALGFAVVFVFVLEMLNPGIRTPEQVQEIFHLPTLGIIPKEQLKEGLHQYIIDNPHSTLAEAVNTLRVSLSVLNPDSPIKSILVTSSVPSEGKSTLSLLIAKQAAKSGQRVVVIDADFRRPILGRQLNLHKRKGLTDILANPELAFSDVLAKDEATGLNILVKGETEYINPTDLFASNRMKVLLDQLRQQYDLIVIDSPPVMAVPDARVLANLVDRVVFTLAWDETPRKVVKSALYQLRHEGIDNLAGIVLQQVNLKQYGRYGDSGYYYHYGRYGQYYTDS